MLKFLCIFVLFNLSLSQLTFLRISKNWIRLTSLVSGFRLPIPFIWQITLCVLLLTITVILRLIMLLSLDRQILLVSSAFFNILVELLEMNLTAKTLIIIKLRILHILIGDLALHIEFNSFIRFLLLMLLAIQFISLTQLIIIFVLLV